MVSATTTIDVVLIFRNTWYNVDVLGVLRGRYRSPVFAVKFGLRAIRNCLKTQLCAIRQEGLDNLGEYPCVFSEIGIPFDLDEKKAYSTGNYSSQIGALDANCFALEGANVGYTFWHYSTLVSLLGLYGTLTKVIEYPLMGRLLEWRRFKFLLELGTARDAQ